MPTFSSLVSPEIVASDDKVGFMVTLGFPVKDVYSLWEYTHGLVQDCSNSNADALDLLQSCTKSSIQKVRRVSCIETGLILGLHPANERRRYKVTPSLIGWAQA